MKRESASRKKPVRVPAAGLFAVLLVAFVDHFGVGSVSLWEWMESRRRGGALERGIVRDRLELHRLQADREAPRAIVVGSSRANAGFFPGFADEGTPGAVRYAKVAHAGIGIFEIRSMAEELGSLRPDAIVVVASEFDLYRPLRARAGSSFGSLDAVWDLGDVVGPSVVWSQRTKFLRLLLACPSRTYRYRAVLQSAFLDDYRRFPIDYGALVFDPGPGQTLVSGPATLPLDGRELAAIREGIQTVFPELSAGGVDQVLRQVRQIRRGPHGEANWELLRRAVGHWKSRGVDVILVEAPLHPVVEGLYDRETRVEFRERARSLEAETGLSFLPLEEMAVFEPEDFRDPTHLGPAGTRRFTRAVDRRVRERLGSLEAKP